MIHSRVIATLNECIGVEATQQLLRKYGGRRVYIPYACNIHDDHPLRILIGHQASHLLAEHYGPGWLTVPRGEASRQGSRNEAICEQFSGGMSAGKLSQVYGLTERHIWRILHAQD